MPQSYDDLWSSTIQVPEAKSSTFNYTLSPSTTLRILGIVCLLPARNIPRRSTSVTQSLSPSHWEEIPIQTPFFFFYLQNWLFLTKFPPERPPKTELEWRILYRSFILWRGSYQCRRVFFCLLPWGQPSIRTSEKPCSIGLRITHLHSRRG